MDYPRKLDAMIHHKETVMSPQANSQLHRSDAARSGEKSGAAEAFHLFGMAELGAAVMPAERNSEIYGESEPADYVYKVVSGTVRTYRVLSDGRRQISGFHVAGDVFGFELGAEHSDSAEAIADCNIMFVRRSTLLAALQRNHEIARVLLTMTGQELQRARDHSLLLIKSAHERVASFLLEMAHRLSNKSEIELPMSRQDIADYLGLTIETVSRTLTQLQGEAAIKLMGSRRIVVRNPSALTELDD